MTELRACCQDDGNLEAEPAEFEDLVVRVCQVCGAKHYSVTVDPGEAFGEGMDA